MPVYGRWMGLRPRKLDGDDDCCRIESTNLSTNFVSKTNLDAKVQLNFQISKFWGNKIAIYFNLKK